MKKKPRQFLEALLATVSPSGYEEEAARLWEDEARGFADRVTRDRHGNTAALIHPGGTPRVMLAGHCDEIGFLVSHITDEGYLWIAPVGGWDPQIAQGQHVVIRGRKGHVPGVIGKCPIHLQKKEEREKVTQIEDLWVDIGVKNRKEAERLVMIGDPLVLDRDLKELEGGRIAGRGLDDRTGAFVVLETLRRLKGLDVSAEVHAVATVQEEIGLRGAQTAAHGIDPVVGIAVDVTFCTDHPGLGTAERRESKIVLGGGPVLSRGPNMNAKVFDLLVRTAKKQKIPYQVNAEPRGTGTDANAMQLNRDGVAAALVSIPNRYMHSPCEMVALSDLEYCADLLAHTIAAMTSGMDFIPF